LEPSLVWGCLGWQMNQPATPRILIDRNRRVALDGDLAEIYGVPTKRLNEQVRRNADKFPDDFAFVLTRQEVINLKSQIATSSLGHGGRRKLPTAFTEHGALMAAMVLNSPQAVQMSIFVVRAFTAVRQQLSIRDMLERRLTDAERKLLRHDSALQELYVKLKQLSELPIVSDRKKIGFRADE
jgi:hypothetical protein